MHGFVSVEVDGEGLSTLLDPFSDPRVQALIAGALLAYVIGRFVIGPRDPKKKRKWYDLRRID